MPSTPFRLILALCFTALPLLVPAPARAGSVETTGGQRIVGTGDTNTTYYAPTGVLDPSGSTMYLYVQGDASLSDMTYTDQILMYQAPNTWAGLTGRYTYVRRILPATAETRFYGHPSAFGDVGKYFMTAHRSLDASNFNEQLLGYSSDGINWTWQTLFTTASGINIPSVTLRYAAIDGQNYWWGYLDASHAGGMGIGQIRVHLSAHDSATSSATPDHIEVLSGGVWRRINVGGHIDFYPDLTMNGFIEPKLHYTANGWELWMVPVFSNNPYCGCDKGSASVYAAEFAYRSTSPAYTHGGTQYVYSTIRCMPGSYGNSRAYPFRIEWTNLLYSMSNDINCREDFIGAYIVVTGFQ